VSLWLLGWRAWIVTKASAPIFVKCNCTWILIKNISLGTKINQIKRDEGDKTPLEWERGWKLKGNILIIFPKL
jgi:hypothetical protein